MARVSIPPATPRKAMAKDKTIHVKRRTAKACDRCRLKKAKCDGAHNCKTCHAADSVCTYSTRRGRDVRNYYSRMRDITDNAMKVLYRACKESSTFPGTLPEEDSDGNVSTNAILRALGLIGPDVDEHGLPTSLSTDSTHEQGAATPSSKSEAQYPDSQDKATPSDLTFRTDNITPDDPSPITSEMAIFINNYSNFPNNQSDTNSYTFGTYPQGSEYDSSLKPWQWNGAYGSDQNFLDHDIGYNIAQ